jgi:ribosomal protein L10
MKAFIALLISLIASSSALAEVLDKDSVTASKCAGIIKANTLLNRSLEIYDDERTLDVLDTVNLYFILNTSAKGISKETYMQYAQIEQQYIEATVARASNEVWDASDYEALSDCQTNQSLYFFHQENLSKAKKLVSDKVRAMSSEQLHNVKLLWEIE